MTQLASTGSATESSAPSPFIALIGNPNAGKTALFNALTGMRAKTANFPGITVDLRRGRLRLPDNSVDLVDLPGLYSLDALSPEEQVVEAALREQLGDGRQPDVVLLVIDATNVERNLFLAGEVLDIGLPTVVALNLIDAADASEITIDVPQLSAHLKCPVVPVSGRTGAGLGELRQVLSDMLTQRLPVLAAEHVSCIAGCSGCTFAARYEWAGRVASDAVVTPATRRDAHDRIDRLLTNPWIGLASFLTMMLAVFYLIFSLAGIPMGLVEMIFSNIARMVSDLMPTGTAHPLLWSVTVFTIAMLVFFVGYRTAQVRWRWFSASAAVVISVLVAALPVADLHSLVVDGVIAGVTGVVIFLPQICILFFFISLLEDSGYMARAAFVMERLMRRVGLPGKAFVPMLSAHACAIPGIMAARVIDNWRDRLVTIIVLPLLTCSARLPVYAMIAALLFGDSPAKGALVFVGAYLVGIAAALLTAYALKKTILPGETQPLILELPPYRMPSLRNALTTVYDRATVFIRDAGTVILLISVVLWGLATFPKIDEHDMSPAITAQVAELREEAARAAERSADKLLGQADRLVSQQQLAHSFAGRIGRFVEPVFRPLGFDWKINVGVISSFAAREVIISTLAIMYGLGDDTAEDDATLIETLRRQQRQDGTPVYTTATSLSLLVFYVLAMQCLPTQVVTRRETGTWKWALFQLGYMTLLAYTASLIVYQTINALGID
jgi:ferrous iron transport protein B